MATKIKPKLRQDVEHPYGANRDNKDAFNGGGSPCGFTVRVPSLKRNKRVWRNFFKLFPSYKAMAQDEDWSGAICIVKSPRIHGGYTRVKTIKLKKIKKR